MHVGETELGGRGDSGLRLEPKGLWWCNFHSRPLAQCNVKATTRFQEVLFYMCQPEYQKLVVEASAREE